MFKSILITLGIIVMLGIASYNYNPAHIEQLLAPGSGTCKKCNRPWAYVPYHITPILGSDILQNSNEGLVVVSRGLFPLCVKCWTELETAEARLPYYRYLYDFWGTAASDDLTWEDVRVSVFFEATGEIPEPEVETK